VEGQLLSARSFHLAADSQGIILQILAWAAAGTEYRAGTGLADIHPALGVVRIAPWAWVANPRWGVLVVVVHLVHHQD
jgi:hypothetical protein